MNALEEVIVTAGYNYTDIDGLFSNKNVILLSLIPLFESGSISKWEKN